jgi:hypothetical protein
MCGADEEDTVYGIDHLHRNCHLLENEVTVSQNTLRKIIVHCFAFAFLDYAMRYSPSATTMHELSRSSP